MAIISSEARAEQKPKAPESVFSFTESDVHHLMDMFLFDDDMKKITETENLLPPGLLTRLHNAFPHRSTLARKTPPLFKDQKHFAGLSGFRQIVSILETNNIHIGAIEERELFIRVYRFLATRHILNMIDWNNFAEDPLFYLVIPQPDMIREEMIKRYLAAPESERGQLIKDYIREINPHDGKQLLNKPWYIDKQGKLEILDGCQHKYEQVHLVFDKTTQTCFAFCTYCFRHAQVRGDEDMFIQDQVEQVHDYLRQHKEVTDVLLTGGDAGLMPYERLEHYLMPLITDPELTHIRTVRYASRGLTYKPEMVIQSGFNKTLSLFKKLVDNGVQVVWMAHFSTPKELLNPVTIAAIRRLRANGVGVRSQSPIMNHISLYMDERGHVDVDKSAQNWIDLGHVLAMLGVGFHSIYCARPTGEHHYFSATLADINKIFSKVYRSLPSISRPIRYITQTSSAGKTSLLGVVEVNGKKAFALKFNQSRNPEWMDPVFLAKYDEKERVIERLKPLDTEKFFFEDELRQIEQDLDAHLRSRMKQ